jgi:L-lactate dehydrogenase complex protein LldG
MRTVSVKEATELFARRIEEVGAQQLDQLPALPDDVFVADRIAAVLPDARPPVNVPPRDRDGDDLVSVIRADAAVAETGSILVVHDDDAELDAIALSRRLIAVLDADQILHSLDDLAPLLEQLGTQHRTWTLITGPSRTADIERVLTIGVHGSIELQVVVLDPAVAGGGR